MRIFSNEVALSVQSYFSGDPVLIGIKIKEHDVYVFGNYYTDLDISFGLLLISFTITIKKGYPW